MGAETRRQGGSWIVRAAMRRPITVVVLVLALTLAAVLAITRMPVDIFPDMGVPIVYVAQPYGGMDPAQMEGFLTNYYEYHFLYITGIEHVESKNIQGTALMKLFFHPGTNMSQAMTEVIGYVNRARAFMPQGTVPPFVMRFDAGSVPVGFLVFSSQTRSIREIQDQALFKVRPMFASLPGVSAPPPFGGNQRTIVIRVDPDKLHSYHITPDEVVSALNAGNIISPSGNIRIGDDMPIVRVNSVARDLADFNYIAIRKGQPGVFLRDIATIQDAADIDTGYALVDGKRAVYICVTKRSDASTLSVVNEVKAALPRMQAILPDDIRLSFEFDQSPTVTRAMSALTIEGLVGAALTGMMVLLFLRDWRSALVVVLNIPLALLASVFALWLSGQTVNIMTLGGLALAVGILVDESTVEIENIHKQMEHEPSVARAVLNAAQQTRVPRLLAMLSILAVFLPSFFMVGAAKAMFVPLSLAVGFAMVGSYQLSSTFVPVLTTWLLRPRQGVERGGFIALFDRWTTRYENLTHRLLEARGRVIAAYFVLTIGILGTMALLLTVAIFPSVDTGQFQLRLRAPAGKRIEHTEKLTQRVLAEIEEEIGKGNIAKSICYVGAIAPSYPINNIYLWTSGPQDAVMRIALKRGTGTGLERLKERLRDRLARAMPGVQFSFEAGDIVSEVLSLGSPTPIEIAVSGPNLAANRAHAEAIEKSLAAIPRLRDLQFGQVLDYPTLDVTLDRARAGFS
ncbi:MAG TPA: efflux RND transporter permease subunit, partial [Phycisphaerae bacterium]|nr:efflux RND transporter permease subunit [Phycisphaerae bacterium]